MEQHNQYSITILRSSGGGAKSILSILNQSVIDKHDPIHHILINTKLHLIDLNQKNRLLYSIISKFKR